MIIITSPPERFSGELSVPGDVSITQQAVMLGSLARGVTEARGFLDTEDCRSTVNCLRSMGTKITFKGGRLIIEGRNKKFIKPAGDLDAGNSNITARLLPGILAGQDFRTTLTGNRSLQKLPVKDIIHPLQLMGALFEGSSEGLPITIKGGELKPINYQSSRANAQVKTAVLLAALYANGTTIIEEPYQSRNHTELMLARFGANITAENCRVTLQGGTVLRGASIRIPGDISAAAFLMVAAAIVPGSEVLLKNVGVNPTRSTIIDILIQMGAAIEVQQESLWDKEPVADLLIRAGSELRGLHISGDMIPHLIDEMPALLVAASVAEGRTVIGDAGELKVNIPDYIFALAGQLKKLGARIAETEEAVIIEGRAELKGTDVDCCGDYRLAMALALAGLVAEGETSVHGAEVINSSFPGFMQALRSLIRN